MITKTQQVALSLELSEYGIGQLYVLADNDQQAADGHRMLAELTPQLRELSAACQRAAVKVLIKEKMA